MSRRQARKQEHPLSMRLPEEDVAIIDRAAGIRGRSRTEFVRDAALQAAELVLMERVLLRMSAAGFRSFAAAVSKAGRPVPELVRVLRRRAPWKTG